jgi:ATP-binding cassette subfamily C protein LapB
MAEAAKNTNNIDQNQISKIYSKLSALRGFSLPDYRFSVDEADILLHADNVELVKTYLDMSWRNAYPNGSAFKISKPSKADMPCLWVSADQNALLLVKGFKSNNAFECENLDGATVELQSARAQLGFFYSVNENDLMQDGARTLHVGPKTATDWFLHSIKKRLMFFVEGVVATSAANILALASSFYAMQVYDRVVPADSYQTLIVLSIGAVIAVVMELVMRQLRAYFVDRACRSIDQELSGVFFDQALSVRMDARPRSVGTFASQLKQFELVRNFMTSSTLFILADAPFTIVFIIVIWMIGGYVALPPLILMPISLALGFYAKFKISKLTEEQVKDANKKNGLLIEAIDGIESIKSIGGEWKFLEMWQELNYDTSSNELRIRNITNFVTNATHMLQQVSYIVLIGVGVYAIHSGTITMGALIACSIISNRALSPISQLAGMVVQYQHAKAALSGLNNLMALPRDRELNQRLIVPEVSQGHLKLENATYSYEEKLVALKLVSLNVSQGERVAVLGPVGSGKSTLLKLMSGLYKPSEGRVFLDDIDMTLISPGFLRENIGYLTQDVRLFNGTLRENLTLGLASPSDEHIIEIASLTFLDRVIKQHPQGLELRITEGGKGLSGGQRQIVGLTRMLLAKPSLLLLDEPTASMDPDLEKALIKNLFEKMPKKTTIIVSTHKTALLNYINRLVLMDKGAIIVDGDRDAVLKEITKNRNKSNVKENENI